MNIAIFLILFYLIYGWLILSSVKSFKITHSDLTADPIITFSVIIPYRNELHNIEKLVQSLREINYPQNKVEFIFVNDHSTDNSQNKLIDQLLNFPFPFLLLLNDGQGKKPALNTGIGRSSNNYIYTTDADCLHPPDLLQVYNGAILTTPSQAYAGPVRYYCNDRTTVFDSYQIIENAGLIVFGSAGMKTGKNIMANGANLCFDKQAYFTVNGYTGSEHIPGGDDQFLIEKLQKAGFTLIPVNTIESLVDTPVQNNMYDIIQQRVRWASKLRFSNKSGFLIQATITICFVLTLVNIMAIFYGLEWWLGCLPWLIKCTFDSVFFVRISKEFRLKLPFSHAISASFIQLIFVPIVAWFVFFGNYSWKNREYSQ